MRPAFRSALLTHVLASSLLLGTLTSAVQAQRTWNGPINGTWDATNTNWDGVSGTPWDAINGPGNTATFNTASLGAIVNTTVYTNGITFGGSSSGGLGGPGTINLAGSTPSITNGVSATINTILGGTAGLTKNGAGILTLNGANTYSGATTISAGAVQINNAASLGSVVDGTIVIGGAQLRLGGGISVAEALTINGLGTGTTNATRGALSNNSGNNTYTGKITLGSNSAINFRNGNSLTLNVGDVLVIGDGDAIDLSNRTLSLYSDNASSVLNINDKITDTGVLPATGGLTVSGVGTVNLNAANTFTGTTTLNQGTLALGNVNALQFSTLDTTGSGDRNTTFTVSGTNTYNLGGLAGNDAININANTLSVGANNESTSYTSVISGAGGLTKVGTGILTLGNNQEYTGGTTVNGGILNKTGGTFAAQSFNVGVNGTLTSSTTLLALGTNTVNGAINGAFNLQSGTLNGSGTITGATTISGALAPGNSSIGILNNVGDVTWNGNGANWVFELGAGDTSDLLNITGNFNKGTTGSFTFDFGGSTEIGTFKLVDWTDNTTFAISDFSYVGLGGGNTGSFAFGGSQLNFSITAVPEPTSMVLVSLVGVAGVAIRARRRKMRFEV